MNIVLMKVLCFSAIPLGIFILIKAFRIWGRIFNGKIISEIPYLQGGGSFRIEKKGYCTVWQKGPLYKRTPVAKFKIRIFNADTRQEVPLNSSIMRPTSNDFSTGRMELYNFMAIPGNYSVQFAEGSNISSIEGIIGKLLPLQEADPSQYSIMVRESAAPFLQPLVIIMFLAGFVFTIGGLVAGLVADKILH